MIQIIIVGIITVMLLIKCSGNTDNIQKKVDETQTLNSMLESR